MSEIVKCLRPDGSVEYTNLGCLNGRTGSVVLVPVTPAQPALALSSPILPQPVLASPGLLLPAAILAAYVFASLACFSAYRADKARAVAGARRIPESALHGLELLGGWPGAWLAQRRFRHKTRKASYQRVFRAIVALHGLLWLGVLLDFFPVLKAIRPLFF